MCPIKYQTNPINRTLPFVIAVFMGFSLVGAVQAAPVEVDYMTANPGVSRHAGIGDTVKLRGGADSTDPKTKLKTLKYKWLQIAGPVVWTAGKSVKIPTFKPKLPGTYQFSLQVYNKRIISKAATVEITVEPNLTLLSPTEGTVWQVGKVGQVKWSSSDINANQKLAIIGSFDGGQKFEFINRSVTAGRKAFNVQLKKTVKTEQAFAAICLMHPVEKDKPLRCGYSSGLFAIR